jgi:hypothetical protein
MALGLCISIDKNSETAFSTISSVGSRFSYISILHSSEGKDKYLSAKINSIKTSKYKYYNTALDLRNDYSEYEVKTQRLLRDIRILFNQFANLTKESETSNGNVSHIEKIEYIVFVDGSTLIMNMHGIKNIIELMSSFDCDIACSRTLGSEYPSSDKTYIEIKHGLNRGRIQKDDNSDFNYSFFIVKSDFARHIANIECTNRWSIEQCLGDALEKGNGLPYVFSFHENNFIDGIIEKYNKRLGE